MALELECVFGGNMRQSFRIIFLKIVVDLVSVCCIVLLSWPRLAGVTKNKEIRMKIEKYQYNSITGPREIQSQRKGGQWYKLLSTGKVFGVYYKAPNGCDTTHKVLKALQRMGHDVNGFQATTKEEAQECATKVHCFYNIYGEAKEVTIYKFNEDVVSAQNGEAERSWKLDKSDSEFTYKILKTKIKCNGDSFKRFIGDACEFLSPFNSWNLLTKKGL